MRAFDEVNQAALANGWTASQPEVWESRFERGNQRVEVVWVNGIRRALRFADDVQVDQVSPQSRVKGARIEARALVLGWLNA